jgi:phosphate-selective porin OprO/OprP
MKLIQSTLLATTLLGITSANAEDGGFLFKGFTGDTALDRTWSMFELYKNDDNPILQEFKLQGRLQLQSIYGESNGNSFNTSDYKDSGKDENVWGDDIEARRARFGFKSKWFRVFKFDALINVDTDGMDDSGSDTLYKDLYEMFVTYSPSDAFNLSVGKTKVRLGREQETSSNNILTLERSLVSNLLHPGELTGIWVSGKGIKGGWLYELGFYGNDRSREFSSGDGGHIVMAKVGYDYAERFGLDSAVASVHVMTNSEPNYDEPSDSQYNPSASPKFSTSIAFTNEITQGRFGLLTDVYMASGENTTAIGQSDVMGITIVPSFFFAEGLQLVGRLQIATSDDFNDLTVPGRYETLQPGDDKGDTYVSAYMGVNYYMYGHKLKLMNGIEFSQMGDSDYSGFTYMSGLRFSF